MGEIADHGGNRKSRLSDEATLILSDLISKNAKRRAYDWARQAMLTESELDEQPAAPRALAHLSPSPSVGSFEPFGPGCCDELL
jgi:hypothetical protein